MQVHSNSLDSSFIGLLIFKTPTCVHARPNCQRKKVVRIIIIYADCRHFLNTCFIPTLIYSGTTFQGGFECPKDHIACGNSSCLYNIALTISLHDSLVTRPSGFPNYESLVFISQEIVHSFPVLHQVRNLFLKILAHLLESFRTKPISPKHASTKVIVQSSPTSQVLDKTSVSLANLLLTTSRLLKSRW